MKWISRAFSCPLEAGNAVYRARTLLRSWGNYIFDDVLSCGLEKKNSGEKILSPGLGATQPPIAWQVYPNPARDKIALEGPAGTALHWIQLYDQLGRQVMSEQGRDHHQQQVDLPAHLPAGIYFVILEQTNGHRQTHKLIIEP